MFDAVRLRMLVLAASVALLAGCGATPEQSHTASTWATSYCSALTDWVTTVDSISRGFVNEPPESTTLAIVDLETLAKEVSQASSNLEDALSRAGRPETPNAAQVATAIAALSHSVQAHTDVVTRAAKSDDQSALAGFRRIQAATGAVNGALGALLNGDATIRRADPALGRALDSSSACKDFRDDVRHGTKRGNQ